MQIWRRLFVGLITSCFLSSASFALDGTGPPKPVPDASGLSSEMMWRARRPAQWSFTAGITQEFMHRPLVVVASQDDEGLALLRDVLGWRVGGRLALSDRTEVALVVPLWIANSDVAGTADPFGGVGDAAISVPHQLYAAEGLAIAWTPTATIPLGSEALLLGDRTPSIRSPIVAEVGGDRWMVLGWTGPIIRGFEQRYVNYRGGLGWSGGISGVGRIGSRLSLGMDARWEWLAPRGGPMNPSPVSIEGGVNGQWALNNQWFLRGGLSGGSPAPGVPVVRMMGHVGRSFSGRRDAEPGESPKETETPNPTLVLTMVDPEGQPIANAVVRADGEEAGRTDVAGVLALEDQRRPPKRLTVEADGYAKAMVEGGGVRSLFSGGEATLTLSPLPVSVSVEVRNTDGEPIPATWTASREGSAETVSANGDWRPGIWRVGVQADGYVSQTRTVEIDLNDPPQRLDFALAPKRGERSFEVVITDPFGRVVINAEVLADGLPVGRTGVDGRVALSGLASDVQALEVRGPQMEPLTYTFSDQKEEAVSLVMAYEAGALRLRVLEPDGEPARDATVRFAGPGRLGPFELDDEGERVFNLRPGTWRVVIGSPDFGLQQRTVEIEEDDRRLQTLEVQLLEPEDGTSNLAIRVVDGENVPVSGASISLDGRSIGRTGSGGGVTLGDLRAGERELSVSSPWLEPFEDLVFLDAGDQEYTAIVQWKPGVALVSARVGSRPVGDATARFVGPQPMEPVVLGDPGEKYLQIAPGRWRVLMSSPTYGMAPAATSVSEERRILHRIEGAFADLVAGDGQITAVVMSPDNRPVRGAAVSLDGVSIGMTDAAGTLLLSGVEAGLHELSVVADGMGRIDREVDITVDAQEARFELGWAVGATRILVRRGEQPATDARLRLGGVRYIGQSAVDANGELFLALEPGIWQAVATGAGVSPAQTRFEVSDQPILNRVELVFDDSDQSYSELALLVRDVNGRPIPGATVSVGSELATESGPGGLAILSVDPGEQVVGVVAAGYVPVQDLALQVREGFNERSVSLQWVPVQVPVRVTAEGQPVAGVEVELAGQQQVAPKRTNADGIAAFSVQPGSWELLVRAQGFGDSAVDLQVAPNQAMEPVAVELSRAMVEVEGDRIEVRDTVYFDTGKATLKEESTPLLDAVAATLRAHPEIVRIVVEGHTDSVGTVEVNYALSRERAQAVVHALVARGVAPERLAAAGFGSLRPVAENQSAEGRAANRRVELRGETAGKPLSSE